MQLQNLSPEYLRELRDRIESKFKVVESGCWEWQAGLTSTGYGKISVKHGAYGAHRIYYQLVRDFLPDELVIDHLCRNPLCVNPDHLEPVTHWENTRRGNNLIAINARKTHCKNGHEFTPENTWRFPSGLTRRKCRQCEIIYMSKRGKERTKEYRALGLNSKGAPLKRKLRGA